MGFFEKLKSVFTRKASASREQREPLLGGPKAASPRKASATRSKRGVGASIFRGRRSYSKVSEGEREKKMARNQEETDAKLNRAAAEKEAKRISTGKTLENWIKASKGEAERTRAGEARAAATRKARENAVAAALKKAPNANEWRKAFRNNLLKVEGWHWNTDPYVPQGSVRKSEKLSNRPSKKGTQKGNKNRSLKPRANNWDPFAAPATATANPSNKVNMAGNHGALNWSQNLTNAFGRAASPKAKSANKRRAEIERNLADLFSGVPRQLPPEHQVNI
jgi:hypothetical protein